MERVRVVGMAIGACASLLCACKGDQLRAEEPVVQKHRPAWSVSIPLHVDAMNVCLERREAPRYVVHLETLPSGPVGVTSVDAYGAVEHCAYEDGKVVFREPVDLAPEQLLGLPVFALGAQQPVVPPGVVLEAVHADELVVGWLYWPEAPADAPSEPGVAETSEP